MPMLASSSLHAVSLLTSSPIPSSSPLTSSPLRKRGPKVVAFAVVAAVACAGEANQSTPDTSRAVAAAVRYDQHTIADSNAAKLTNPLEGDSVARRAGEVLFASFNCDGCHGGGAVGVVGPSLADGRWRYGGDAGTVYQSIYYGRPKGMPAYGGILPETAIWQLVTYATSLPLPSVVPTVAWP